MLSNTLQAVISQSLFRRIDQPGMVACIEILICTTAVRKCIRDGRIHEIPGIIETSRRLGMQTMDQGIAEIYCNGFIDYQEALARAAHPELLEKQLAAMGKTYYNLNIPQPQASQPEPKHAYVK
jgi:twitching motility protein PilT